MAGLRPDEPGQLLGAYRRLGDVPERYRLGQHADAYEGRDTWRQFVEATILSGSNSEQTIRRVERQGAYWRSFMNGRGRHHALAEPADVEAYAGSLLEQKADRTAAAYFRRLRSFYGWLLTSTEHPHVYSPVLMAADAGGDAAEIWEMGWRNE